MNTWVNEIDRRLANLITLGTVEEADYAAARLRVRVGDLLTGFLPWLTLRAGGDRSWWAPEIGEQVILLSPSGDLAQAVILPAVYQAAYPANGDSPEIHRVDYGNGSFVEHDRRTGALRVSTEGDIEIVSGGNVRITAAGSIQLTGQRIDLN